MLLECLVGEIGNEVTESTNLIRNLCYFDRIRIDSTDLYIFRKMIQHILNVAWTDAWPCVFIRVMVPKMQKASKYALKERSWGTLRLKEKVQVMLEGVTGLSLF